MNPTGYEFRDGTNVGYFDKEYKRVFNGDPYPVPERHGMSTLVPFYTGKHLMKIGSSGSYAGCFNDHIDYFSPELRIKPPEEKHLPNFVGGLGSKCGSGYTNDHIDYFSPELRIKPPKEKHLPNFASGSGGKNESGFSNDHIDYFSPELRIKPPKEKHLPNFASGSGGKYGSDYSNDHIDYFSPELRTKPLEEKQLPNFVTSPGRKGGSGYSNITIGKYPEHKADPLSVYHKHHPVEECAEPFHNSHYTASYFDKNPFREYTPVPLYVQKYHKKSDGDYGNWMPTDGSAKSEGTYKKGPNNNFSE